MNDTGYTHPAKEAHFLNEEQKKVKALIMERMLNSFYGTMMENEKIFDNQSTLDLIFSILVMFNREVLMQTFIAGKFLNKRNMVMKNLFETIRSEVNKKANEIH